MLDRYIPMTRRIFAAAVLGIAPVVLASGSSASAAPHPAKPLVRDVRPSNAVATYEFETLNDHADPTFNQLLGINNEGVIAGYFGSGAAGHPNRGYTLHQPFGQANYRNENFPGSVQTQVVAINNRRATAGFWIDANGNNFGFVEWNGVFAAYRNPHSGTGTVNQLLGLNDDGVAVGFYTNGLGVNHGYALDVKTSRFEEIVPPGTTNVTATGINDDGDVTGFCTASNGAVVGFLLKDRRYAEFVFPGATSTTPFGLNRSDEIVGSYVDAAGKSHGFTLKDPLTRARFHTIDDPYGVGTTVVNGVNDAGTLVGFYVDGNGNTDGFTAKR